MVFVSRDDVTSLDDDEMVEVENVIGRGVVIGVTFHQSVRMRFNEPKFTVAYLVFCDIICYLKMTKAYSVKFILLYT